MDVDGGLGKRSGDITHAAGMVEVDVGHDRAGQVRGSEAEALEVGQQDRRRV